MAIKIVLPEGEGIKSTHGTKVYTQSGEEIKHIERIQIDWCANEVATATITVCVGELINFTGIEETIVKRVRWPWWRRKLWALGLIR